MARYQRVSAKRGRAEGKCEKCGRKAKGRISKWVLSGGAIDILVGECCHQRMRVTAGWEEVPIDDAAVARARIESIPADELRVQVKALRVRQRACTGCRLGEQARERGARPTTSSGPPDASWAIVGEAPGRNEEQGGEPFVGRSGRLLRSTLEEVGLDPEEALILNVVGCWPVDPERRKTRPPKEDETKACDWTEKTLAMSKVTNVLLLGATATRRFTKGTGVQGGRGRSFPGIGALEGRTMWVNVHPAFVLRQRWERDRWQKDLARFASAVKGG